MLKRRFAISAVAAIALGVAPVLVAHAGPGTPKQDGYLEVDIDGFPALDVSGATAPSGLAPDNHGGLWVGTTPGALHMAVSGDQMRTVTGAGAVTAAATDQADHAFVSYAGSQTVTELSASGAVLNTFPAGADVVGLAFDPNNPDYGTSVLYVLASNNAVSVLDTAFNVLSGWWTRAAQSIAVAPSHDVYIGTSANGIVRRYTDAGFPLDTFKVVDSTGVVGSPRGLAIDSQGTIYVADPSNDRIVEFSTPAGSYLGEFGDSNQAPSGQPPIQPGTFDGPTSLAVDCLGRLWVLDENSTSHTARILRFSAVAAPTGSCGAETATSAVSDDQAGFIAVDAADDVYTSTYGVLKKFDKNGSLITTWGNPTTLEADGTQPTGSWGYVRGLAASPSGEVYVTSYLFINSAGTNTFHGVPSIMEYRSAGTFVQQIHQVSGSVAFNDPRAITVRSCSCASNGHIFVSDANAVDPNVQEFAPGTPWTFVRHYALHKRASSTNSPVPLSLGFDPSGNLLVSIHQAVAIGGISGAVQLDGAIEKFDTSTGSWLGDIEVPLNPPNNNAPQSFVVASNGSMFYGMFQSIPFENGPTGAILSVGSTGIVARMIENPTFNAYSAPRLARDCAGRVYATDTAVSRYVVLKFSSLACRVLPTAITGGVKSKTSTSITVNAQSNPEAQVTKVRVLYGLTTSYGQATAWVTLPSDNITLTTAIAFSGLLSGHTYHYKVQATNLSGTANGVDQTATTS